MKLYDTAMSYQDIVDKFGGNPPDIMCVIVAQVKELVVQKKERDNG